MALKVRGVVAGVAMVAVVACVTAQAPAPALAPALAPPPAPAPAPAPDPPPPDPGTGTGTGTQDSSSVDGGVDGGVAARKMRVFEVGKMGCDPAAAVKRLGKCRAIKMKGTSGAAFDGNTCSVWNAGAPPPQMVEGTLALEAVTRLDAMILVPEMTPPKAHVVHQIEVFGPSSSGRKYAVDAMLATNEGYLLVFDGSPIVEKLRVTTTESPSWVAWREIVLVDCEDRITVPTSMKEITPIPPRTITPGTGACTADTDCARDRCCGPRTCTAKANAPSCNGVGCGQSFVAGEMTESTARCVCDHGTCGAWFYGPRGLQ